MRVISPSGLEKMKERGVALSSDKEAQARSAKTLRENWADPAYKEKHSRERAKNLYPPSPKPRSSPY